MKRQPTLHSHTHCQVAQSQPASQNLAKSMAVPPHNRQIIKTKDRRPTANNYPSRRKPPRLSRHCGEKAPNRRSDWGLLLTWGSAENTGAPNKPYFEYYCRVVAILPSRSLSRVSRKVQARFLGDEGGVTRLSYPTNDNKI